MNAKVSFVFGLLDDLPGEKVAVFAFNDELDEALTRVRFEHL